MINETKEVCLFENLDQNVPMSNENLEQQLFLQDPFDSVWLKVIAILSYFICVLASAIMLKFIRYENEHHGNFRTVINQLLSNLYAMVSYTSNTVPRHYNPRFVYFLPTFKSPKTIFQRAFFFKFWPYVWLVFKSGL